MDSIHKIKLTCKEATMLATMKDEDGVSRFSTIRLFLHGMGCGPCRRFIKQFKSITKGAQLYLEAISSSPTHHLSSDKKKVFQENINKIG